ncbi:hypothetical protein RclHR1_08950010 [Rhizophagus clarus]|nr:hypothetical protein RclHR1_08950010 [Rhizophagus clarus]
MKSAIARNANGQCKLGYCYDHGMGTTKNELKAFEWYLKSAENGNIMAQKNLGYCYLNGSGTVKNEIKAFEWCLKSAEGGNAEAQNYVGKCYYDGALILIKQFIDIEKLQIMELKRQKRGDLSYDHSIII